MRAKKCQSEIERRFGSSRKTGEKPVTDPFVIWSIGPRNDVDLYAENLAWSDPEKHVDTYAGKEECSEMN